jgi:D-alanyl-D-alanine carboxypeptidase/D-alanyl-D-alanine-endopeptidase (penicillin-binding protein 4)
MTRGTGHRFVWPVFIGQVLSWLSTAGHRPWRKATKPDGLSYGLHYVLFLSLSCFGADLGHSIDVIVDTHAAHANIGIQVLDLATGKALYSRDENRFFLPASNMKLLTTGLALTKLGPQYRFETEIFEEASGDLALVGSGDPSLSGRVYPYNPSAPAAPPLHAIEELAEQAVANGLQRVRGNIVGDDRLYPWAPYPPAWTQDDVLKESGAPVSALSVSDNFIAVTIAGGDKPGDLATLALSPSLEYFSIDNRILTVAGKGEPLIRISRAPGSRQLLLTGTFPITSSNVRELIALDDPALYAACALYEALTRRGVVVLGHPVARHRAVGDAYEPPTGVILATRTSPPLTELLQMTDKVSENLHAELMLREVARVGGRSGTRAATIENGLASLNTFLADAGASARDSRLDDGSGLSRNAQVTPKLVTQLLSYMFHSPNHEDWIAMLPVGGEDGTLGRRMCCSTDAHAIHAKTGTLARAIALSGYAESKTRGWLAFSILVNDFAAPAAEIQAWIDKIALTLVE